MLIAPVFVALFAIASEGAIMMGFVGFEWKRLASRDTLTNSFQINISSRLAFAFGVLDSRMQVLAYGRHQNTTALFCGTFRLKAGLTIGFGRIDAAVHDSLFVRTVFDAESE